MAAREATSGLYEVVKCRNCAAELKFKPGTTHLVCPYCRAENEITDVYSPIEEIDYETFISDQYASEERLEVLDVKCSSCGAETTFPPNVSSMECPYCMNNLILAGGSNSTVLKPKAILPFLVDQRQARGHFDKWLKGKWFLPSDLKRSRRLDDKLVGIYIPYWTFDSRTTTDYTGQRGIHYTTTVTVPTTVNGKTVMTTKTVVKTRWHFVSGRVFVHFDDTLVVASTSLNEKYVDRLEPFDLHNLVPFDERFLSGFRTEIYQVDVREAFDRVKEKMGAVIRNHIRADIGGDEQRILSANTQFDDVTFKHILLPIWISSYRYKKKVYRFLINGRSGETHGERPYDKWKIAIAVLLGIFVVLAIAVLVQGR